MVRSNTLRVGKNPESKKPRSSKADKWTKLLSVIWANRREYEGSGVVVIPSDPNALLERLASKEAGHTGVRNELVSICDKLKKPMCFRYEVL